MTTFIGSFEVASLYLPALERICDEHGGSVLVTQEGISYQLPVRLDDQEPVLTLVRKTLEPATELPYQEFRQAA